MEESFTDITFVVATYKRFEALQDCLASLSVTYPNSKVIVVNDDPESGDLHFEDPRILYIQNSKNLGCPKSRSVGAKLVKTPLIFFLDDDATVGDVDLAVAKKVLNENASIVICGFPARNHINGKIHKTGFVSIDGGRGDLFFDTPAFNGGACLVRANFFLPRGYHPRIDGYGEEAELTLRALSTGFRVVGLENCGAIDHYPNLISRETNLARQRLNDVVTAFEYGGLYMGIRQFIGHLVASLKLRSSIQLAGCVKGLKSGIKIVNQRDRNRKVAYRRWIEMARHAATSSE